MNRLLSALGSGPVRGLPPVDRSYVLVQSELYVGEDGGTPDLAKLAAESPDAVVFNGYPDQYAHEPLRARVHRLRCFRGVDDLTALTIAAELGDPRRFATAPSLMAYVGLVPSEHSSGGTRRQGGITKTGLRISAACSSSPPGTIVIIPSSAPPSGRVSAARRPRRSPPPGPPNSGSTVATHGSRRAANGNNTSSRSSRESSQAFSGRP